MKIEIKGTQENNLKARVEGWDLTIDIVHNTISGNEVCEDEVQFEELEQELKNLINKYQEDILEALNRRFDTEYVKLEENYIDYSEGNEEFTFSYRISDLKKYDRVDVEGFRDSIKICHDVKIEYDAAEQEVMTALERGEISYREFERKLDEIYTELETMNE